MRLRFSPLSVSDQPAIDKFIAKSVTHESDFSVATLLLWTDFCDINVCITDDAVYINGYVDDQFVFLSPLCDVSYYPTAVQNIKEYCDKEDKLLRIIYATRPQVTQLLLSQNISADSIATDYLTNTTFKTDNFCFKNDRNLAEYCYLPTNLINLSGQKLQNKKHRLALFHHTYDGHYVMRPMTDDDIDGIEKMTVNWNQLKGYDYHEELRRLLLLIRNRDMLHIELHLLMIDNKIAGMTMFQRLANNVGLVLFEKCDSNHLLGFAELNHYAAEQMKSCSVINRQEDLGLQGLRLSKMTYQPVEMVEKFIITQNLQDQILPLYRNVFGDSENLTDIIFNTNDYISHTAIDVEDGKVVSCGFVRTKRMRAYTKIIDLPYIFGIATDPKYRGHGRAKKVINELLFSLYHAGMPIAMLCPAEGWLYDYYKKFGFMRFNFTENLPFYTVFKPNTILSLGTDQDAQTITDLFNTRNNDFTFSQYRTVDDSKNRLNEVTIDGGKLLLLSCDNEYYGYILSDENNEAIETFARKDACSPEQYNAVKNDIDAQLRVLNVTVNTAEGVDLPIETPLSQLDFNSKLTQPSTMLRIIQPQVLMENLLPCIKIDGELNINFFIKDDMLHNSIFNLKAGCGIVKITYEIDKTAKDCHLDIDQLAQWLLGKTEIEGLPKLLNDLNTVFYEEF